MPFFSDPPCFALHDLRGYPRRAPLKPVPTGLVPWATFSAALDRLQGRTAPPLPLPASSVVDSVEEGTVVDMGTLPAIPKCWFFEHDERVAAAAAALDLGGDDFIREIEGPDAPTLRTSRTSSRPFAPEVCAP